MDQPVTTVEIPHRPLVLDLRGGPNTGDHVDIMGNHQLLDLVLKVATGQGDSVAPNVVSSIDDLTRLIDDANADNS